MRLKAERLFLRPLCGADVQALFAYRSLPEVYRLQGWQPSTITEAANFIEEYALREGDIQVGQWHQLGICLGSGERLIGDCGFQLVTGSTAFIGYTISPFFQHMGYGYEAVSTLVGYLFNEIGLHSIFARTLPVNPASIRLLERMGFHRLDDAEKWISFPDAETDELIFCLKSSNGLA